MKLCWDYAARGTCKYGPALSLRGPPCSPTQSPVQRVLFLLLPDSLPYVPAVYDVTFDSLSVLPCSNCFLMLQFLELLRLLSLCFFLGLLSFPDCRCPVHARARPPGAAAPRASGATRAARWPCRPACARRAARAARATRATGASERIRRLS